MPPSAVTAEAVAAAAVAADAAAAARDATAAAHDELDTMAEEPAAVTTATEPPVAASDLHAAVLYRGGVWEEEASPPMCIGRAHAATWRCGTEGTAAAPPR